jgi:hypothetical protein
MLSCTRLEEVEAAASDARHRIRPAVPDLPTSNMIASRAARADGQVAMMPARTATIVLAALLTIACASTTLRDFWLDPDFRGGPFRNILVVAVDPSATQKRTFEDIFSAAVARTGAQGIPGWRAIPEQANSESVWNAAVEASGADGLMLVRLLYIDRRTNVTPVVVPSGPMFGYGWGYYNAWATVPQVSQYDVAVVETRVFDVRSRKLVWSGITETFQPTSVAQETPGFAGVILSALARNGLVPHGPQ